MRNRNHSLKTALGAAVLLLAGNLHAQTIYKTDSYQWKGNQFIQGKMKAQAKSATELISNYSSEWTSNAPNYMPKMPTGIDPEHWKLSLDISALPHYESSLIIDNALFNLSLEESEKAIEPDSTYRTGVYWGGVWTRDVSYSILHSLAQLCPEVCRKSLLAKVNANNRIIQDTGTGGAWPCSTDRVTWVLAAWEVYLVTGDKQWLDRIFPIIRNTVEDDHVVAFDSATKLMHGETSWLDWREQEYPAWAQPVDIYNSEPMGTNAIHYRSQRILAEICRLEGQTEWAKKYDHWADELREGMNSNLWLEDKGLYSIYLYGRNNLVAHPMPEILGESFAILWDIASPERQRRISESMISEPFGTPDFYPQLRDQYPYHNDAMWPFTQAYWMKAQAKVGNEEGVLHAISSIYRLAAMNLTNLENMVIYDGNDKGLAINSPRQLWSVAADLAIVPNIYFGVNYELDGIHFRPFVPKTLKANRTLRNFKYRKAVLNMSVTGFGNELQSFRIDGVECAPFLAADIEGEHTVEMVLCNRQPAPMKMIMKKNAYQPLTPVVALNGNSLSWKAEEGVSEYIVLRNGAELAHVTATGTEVLYDLSLPGEYAVLGVSSEGYRGFFSEPLNYKTKSQVYQVEDYAMPFNPLRKSVKESAGGGGGEAGKTQQRSEEPTLEGVDVSGAHNHMAMITRNENILISIPVEVAADGRYAIDWRYANGSGSTTSENKCASRILSVDGRQVGVSVFAQRGEDEWNNWGWSNACIVNLTKGRHVVSLEFADAVENMNILVNQALLDELRVTSLNNK